MFLSASLPSRGMQRTGTVDEDEAVGRRHRKPQGGGTVKQFMITPAAGKRLIAKAIAAHPAITSALEKGTVVIVAGTTNGYVAEEILGSLGQAEGFSRRRFFRGITLPPSHRTTDSGRMADESKFPGDVIIVKGRLEKGREIFDVVDDLKEGDVIVKGANAVDLATRTAAIYIGHPKAGTIGVGPAGRGRAAGPPDPARGSGEASSGRPHRPRRATQRAWGAGTPSAAGAWRPGHRARCGRDADGCKGGAGRGRRSRRRRGLLLAGRERDVGSGRGRRAAARRRWRKSRSSRSDPRERLA